MLYQKETIFLLPIIILVGQIPTSALVKFRGPATTSNKCEFPSAPPTNEQVKIIEDLAGKFAVQLSCQKMDFSWLLLNSLLLQSLHIVLYLLLIDYVVSLFLAYIKWLNSK